MIYSKKYGRYFNNRSELQRYAFWDYRTKPILSWGGLRDCLYSEAYKREHGLPYGSAWRTWGIFVVLAGLFNMLMGVLFFFQGEAGGILLILLGGWFTIGAYSKYKQSLSG